MTRRYHRRMSTKFTRPEGMNPESANELAHAVAPVLPELFGLYVQRGRPERHVIVWNVGQEAANILPHSMAAGLMLEAKQDETAKLIADGPPEGMVHLLVIGGPNGACGLIAVQEPDTAPEMQPGQVIMESEHEPIDPKAVN